MRSRREPPPRPPVLLTPFGGPETMFGLTPIRVEDGCPRLSMPSGSWLTGQDGSPSAGALGVLLDVALGQSVILNRLGDHFTVTTELSIDFCAPLPLDGRMIHAESRIVACDEAGGLASGRVHDEDGTTIAVATTWHLFIPAVPSPADTPTVTAAPPTATSLGALLDLRPGPSGVVVLPSDARFTNPLGPLHGGILACACEVAARAAVGRPELATAALRVRYHRPGVGTVTFTPHVSHAGRTFAVAEVEARDADGRVCGSATVTFRAAARN